MNAIKCVKATKCQLDELRKEKWVKLLDDVHGFCDKNDICKLEMEDEYIDPKKRRHKSGITNKHYYQVDCLMMLFVDYFKSLTAVSMRQALNCLFARPLLTQGIHFRLSMWRI